MDTVRKGVRKRCKHCGGWLDARLVQARRPRLAGLQAIIFRKTAAVLTCPKCDTAPQERKDILWCPTR